MGTPKIHSCGVLCPVVPGAGKGARDRSAGCSLPLSCCPRLLGCQVSGAWALLCSSPCPEEGSWRPCGCREAGRRCGCCGAGRTSSSLNLGSRWVPTGFVPQRQRGRGLLPFPPRKAAFSLCWRDWRRPPGWEGSSAPAGSGSRQRSRSISQQSLAAEPCSPSPCRAAESPLAASRRPGAPRGPCAGWGLAALGERRSQLFYVPSASVSCARSNHLLQ